MKSDIRQIRVCPLCGKAYAEPPALSRTDNETLICPDCGTRQALDGIGISPALESIGISAEEQDKILSILHRTRE